MTTPSTPEKPDTPIGLECPDCGCCDLRVYYTRRLAKAIRRVKTCRHCGRRITTTERIVG